MTTSPNTIPPFSSYFETTTTNIDMTAEIAVSRDALRDLSPLIVSWLPGEKTVTVLYPPEYGGIKISVHK